MAEGPLGRAESGGAAERQPPGTGQARHRSLEHRVRARLAGGADSDPRSHDGAPARRRTARPPFAGPDPSSASTGARRPRNGRLHRRSRGAREVREASGSALPLGGAPGRSERSLAAEIALLSRFARGSATRRVGRSSREPPRARLSPPRGGSLPAFVADPGAHRPVLQRPALVIAARAAVLPGERHVATLRAEPDGSPARVRSCGLPALPRARAALGLRAHRSGARRCSRARRACGATRGLAGLAPARRRHALRHALLVLLGGAEDVARAPRLRFR